MTRKTRLLLLSACIVGLAATATFGQRPQGFDLSHWEAMPTIAEYQESLAAGFVFQYTKGTDGTWYIDPTASPNMTNALAAGLYTGVYHFCHPDTYSATAEADYFVDHMGAFMTTGYLRPCLDLEDGTSLGATNLTTWCNTFMDRVETRTGVEPIIYTNTDYALHYLTTNIATRDLWVAQYLYNPQPQTGSPNYGVFNTWKFWQWTDAGYVPPQGLRDSNVFNGTMLQLYSFVIGGGSEPAIVLDQPVSATIPLTGTGVFSITAGGSGTIGYQWRKGGTNMSNGGHYAGVTTATLTVSSVNTNDAATYTCYVSNAYGNDTSNGATLTVGDPPTDYIVESRTGGQNFYTGYSETGTWYDSSGKSTAVGCTPNVGHRYCTIGGAHTATYRFRPALTATYQIFTTNLNTYNSGEPLVHKVAHSGGTTNVNVCQNNPCSPNPIHTWYSLGSFALTAGTEYTVIQDASVSSPANNAGRADSIKWVRLGGSSLPPTITANPAAAAISAGGSASFIVAATGDGTLSYQWQKNGTNQSNGGHYAGCTTATLTVSSADTNDAADYRCKVSNAYGTATSNAATLTITGCVAPTITNADFEAGNSSGIADGWTGYQRATNPTTVWTIQTASPPGSGLQYQQIANTSATGGGGVLQHVTGTTSGSVYTVAGWMRTNSASATAQVKVCPTASTTWANAIDLVPAQSTTSSTWVAFSGNVTATGTSMTIWLDGHTGSTGLNKAVAFDLVTIIVSTCATPPSPKPTITTNPSNQTIAVGGSASFGVVATGDGTLTYQWQKDGANIYDGGHYSGTSTATMTVSSADTNDQASYSCIVTNEYGSAFSTSATLTVVTCGTPVLTNGNFEYSTAGSPPYGWTTYVQSAKTGAWTIQTASPPQGTRWQQTQMINTGAYAGIRQNVTGLTSGSVYTISGSYKTNSTSATASVRYNLSGNTDRASSTSLVSKTATSWSTFSSDVTASGSSMMLFLDILSGTSASKAVGFDNIKVVCK